jgi:hypothetical protein
MFGGEGEAINTPHHDCVELPLPGVVHQFIKIRARVFRAGLAHVNAFADQIKSSRPAVGPEIADLKLATLTFAAYPSLDFDSHASNLRGDEREQLFSAQYVLVYAAGGYERRTILGFHFRSQIAV